MPTEIALSEPGEWADILGEFQELVQEVAAPIDIETVDIETDTIEEADDGDELIEDLSSADQPLDMDTQFALQAEAMGIDISGIGELEEDVSEEDPESEPESDVLEDSTEPESEELEAEIEFEDEEDEDEPELKDDEFDDEPVLDDEEFDDEAELVDEIEQLDLIDDQDEQQELIEEPVIESHTIEDELALGDGTEAEEDDSDEHYVPPMTEEEHTVNMQIDEELMALAIEDEDGFASTIVIPAKDTEKKARKDKNATSGDDGESKTETADDKASFETIIMEGESIRSALDNEKFATDAAAAAKLAEQANAKEADQAKQSGGRRYGIIAGIGALVLLLVVQLIHQSRETLATIPAFSNTISTIYRAIGQPVQPAWDITGWRFEVTTSSTDGEPDELTVYSRLGNSSDGPLPYPLIGISLSDRFEETLGSRVLDPGDYLPTDLDPRKLVNPGSSFNAIITIRSASEEATSFNLKVCYRMTNGQLRCKDDSFLR